EGLPQRWLRGLLWRTLEKFELHIVEPSFGVPPSGGKSPITQPPKGGTPNLPSRANAIRMIHFPEELTDVEIARQRLALDEFIVLQLQIQSRRKKFEAQAKALPCGGDNRLIKPFLTALGFKLTDAQTRVLREIRADLRGAHPMRRLLQGDVGSGKTAVAACAALMTLESGFNVALMAPTEILAEQHFQNFQRWFEPLGIKVEMQTGSWKTSNIEHRTSNVERTASANHAPRTPHHVSLFIGTHALLTSGFDLPKLGLVIIDEQHKFGVAQRERLVRKGRYPHLLVMTATPIPRTLGLTLYGDLDVSVIDELPAGRGTVKTFVRLTDKLPKVWEFIREKLAAGRQVYVVYPRVEENADGFKAVTKEFENLKKLLAPFRVGLLHGRLKSAEKEMVMAEFRANKTNVLLATSLIEVGVDVPNASVMLIENAEAFGLAQLHQLRGRIGRGAHESFCILISDAKNEESRSRLKILEETNDGFKIAEVDLKLRGPGELLGQQQSGAMKLRFGDLVEDLALIRQAREIAVRTVGVQALACSGEHAKA
ncbi:MAG TPA: ATP-dependent DNA helicase RecG, partial [Verrucomicrobiae bacterium]